MFGRAARLVPAVMAILVVTGCGGSHGPYLGGGGGVTVPPGTPDITGLSPDTAIAGSAAFTLTATGSNFGSSTSIIFGNTTLTTTVVSSTEMQAQVPASLLIDPGSVSVIPSPETTLNFGSSFTITGSAPPPPPPPGSGTYTESTFPVEANDMVWDSARQQFYVSIASSDPADANSIAIFNPATNQLGTVVSAGNGVDQLAISSDGSYLYAGIDSNGSIQRFTLPTLQADISIPIGTGSDGLYDAMDIEAAPGNPNTIAVVRGTLGLSPPETGGIVIYDDAVARAKSVPGDGSGLEIDRIVWNSGATNLYGLDTTTFGASVDFYDLAVSSAGVQFANSYPTQDTTYGQNLHYDATTGKVYTDNGEVIDPATGKVVAQFPVSSIQGESMLGLVMVPDSTLNLAYFLGQPEAEPPGNYLLAAYDMTTYQLIGSVPITGLIGAPAKLVRWGSNGLALLSGDGIGGTYAGCGITLISGEFVTSPSVQ